MASVRHFRRLKPRWARRPEIAHNEGRGGANEAALSLSLFSSCFDCSREAFCSPWRKLHFCGRKAAEQKMHHSFEASVGDNMERLQFSFKTHFSLWVPVGDSVRITGQGSANQPRRRELLNPACASKLNKKDVVKKENFAMNSIAQVKPLYILLQG
jgi:hypothetical protein